MINPFAPWATQKGAEFGARLSEPHAKKPLIVFSAAVIVLRRLCLFAALVFVVSAQADDIEIVNFRNGRLTWTNATTNAMAAYTVQWAPSLGGDAWRAGWSNLDDIVVSGAGTVTAAVPMFYRVVGESWSDITNETELRTLYSNAVVNSSNATAAKIWNKLTPIAEYNTNLSWRTNALGVKQVKVASFMTAGTASSYYNPGETNITGGDQWVTVYPELKNICRDYSGPDQVLRIKKLLGMPPWSPNDTIVEFWVAPEFLIRPCPDPAINDCECGVVNGTNAPMLAVTVGMTTNYVAWYNNILASRYYDIPLGNLSNSWPWTRLGYTYDWGQSSNRIVGLSEFVIPNWRAWPGGSKSVPIEVETVTNAATYGH